MTGTVDPWDSITRVPFLDFPPMAKNSSPSDGRTYVVANDTNIKDQGAKQVGFLTVEGITKIVELRRTNVKKKTTKTQTSHTPQQS